MNQQLLEGDVVLDDRDTKIAELERQVSHLQGQVRRAQVEAEEATRQAARAVSELRRQLSPLYRALQMVFGEMETVGSVENPEHNPAGAAPADGRIKGVWEAWKTRLGGQCAKVIDALMSQSDMNTTQLAIAIGTRRQNVPPLIFKLNQAGLIDKHGGRFSLKKL